MGIRKLYGYPNHVSNARFLRQSVPGFNLYVGFPIASANQKPSHSRGGESIIVVT